MEKSKTNQLSTLAALLLLVAILVIIFVVVPQVSSIREYSNQITQKEADLSSGEEQVQAIREYALVIKAARADVEKLGVSIPTEEKADEAVLQIASAASSAGIDLMSVSIASSSSSVSESATSDSGAGGTLSLTISTTGEYGKTIAFVGNLEKNLRPVAIKNMSIAVDSENSSTISGSFLLEFPYIEASSSATSSTSENTTSQEENAGQ